GWGVLRCCGGLAAAKIQREAKRAEGRWDHCSATGPLTTLTTSANSAPPIPPPNPPYVFLFPHFPPPPPPPSIPPLHTYCRVVSLCDLVSFSLPNTASELLFLPRFCWIRSSSCCPQLKLTPATYHPTHNRTLPPPNQGFILLWSRE
ncbi:hypothetical protein BHE74_00031936, partial [Ensete ventricosum]